MYCLVISEGLGHSLCSVYLRDVLKVMQQDTKTLKM